MKSDINKSKMLVCLLSCGMLTLGTGWAQWKSTVDVFFVS